MADDANDVLVSTAWVRDHLDDPEVRIIEVDEDPGRYAEAHVPGAIGLDWRTDLQDDVRGDFLGPEEFSALMASKGVSNEHIVVLYGDRNNWFAAYTYWYFRYYGHWEVRLVDGPREKWIAEGRPTSTEVPAYAMATYTADEGDEELRADRDDVMAALGTDTKLVDVRAPRSVTPDGSFRSVEELRESYGGEGLLDGSPVITFCGVGERSAHAWFVLHELLGHDNVRNYDGSTKEWGSLVGGPVAEDV